jgi:hypothetical protein
VYDSGVVFYPQCLLWDYGNHPWDTIIVRFRIGSYMSSCTLYGAHVDTVTAPDPYTTMPGIWECRASAIVAGDLHPENNTKVDTFTVRGSMRETLWVRVLMPDTIDTTPFTPMGRYGNAGIDAASFEAYFSIFDSAGMQRVYADSTPVLLGAGDSIELAFSNAQITVPGAYLAVAWTLGESSRVYADSHYFWVVPGSGIEESPPQAPSHKLQATFIRSLPAGAVAFDPTGRRVLNPKSGIYFVMEYSVVSSQHSGTANGARNTVRVRKVILQR